MWKCDWPKTKIIYYFGLVNRYKKELNRFFLVIGYMQPPISQNISHVWSHVDFTRLACLKESVNVDNKCHFLKFWVCLIFSYSWNICISKLVYPSFMHIIISQWRFSQIFFQLPNNNERVKQYEQKWAETPLMQNYGPPGGFFMHDFFSLAGKLQRSITWPDFFL